jgi:hypothetical protein
MASPDEPVSSDPAGQPPSAGPRRAHHLPAALLALATFALAILLAIVLWMRWQQPAYVMPFAVVGVGVLCAVLTGCGGAMAALRGQVTPWLAPLVTLMLVYAFLSFLVIGVLVVVPTVLVVLLLVERRSRRVEAASTPRWRAGAGLLLTLGLIPLSLLVLLGGPVVECTPEGVETSTPIWSWSGSLSAEGSSGETGGSGSSSDLSRTSGSVTEGATTYTYVCLGSKLLNFDAHA